MRRLFVLIAEPLVFGVGFLAGCVVQFFYRESRRAKLRGTLAAIGGYAFFEMLDPLPLSWPRFGIIWALMMWGWVDLLLLIPTGFQGAFTRDK